MPKHITDSEFRKRVNKTQKNRFIILSKYKGTHSLIKVKCKKCGQEGWCNAENLENREMGINCKHFFKMDDSIFKQRVFRKQKGRIKILGCYLKTTIPVLIECNKCHRRWQAYPSNLLHNEIATNCSAHNSPLSFDNVQTRINNVSNGAIKMIGQFTTVSHKALMKCKKCGNTWKVAPNQIYSSGYGCPFCVRSKGEEAVAKYLKENKILFKSQHTFSACKDHIALPFDFAIFNKNGSLNSLIEFQGAQHYFDISEKGQHGYFDIPKIIKHDRIKSIYCQKHNIKLIYIKHPETSKDSYKQSFYDCLVKRTLDKELKVS